MAGLHDQLVDLIEQLRREQAHVVLECLMVIADILKSTMAEHFADRVVMIDKFVQTIVINVEVQPDHAADQYRPQGHAGTAIVFVHPWGDLTRQQLEDRGSKRGVHVQVLQAPQDFGDVVA